MADVDRAEDRSGYSVSRHIAYPLAFIAEGKFDRISISIARNAQNAAITQKFR